MPIWKAIILGILQGLAEFLPISSSGHLVIFKSFLNVDLESGGMFFDVMLHAGTLLAIFVAFWRDIKKMVIEGFKIIGDFFINIIIFFKRRTGDTIKYRRIIRTGYRKFVMMVIVSTIPTGIIGIVLSKLGTIELVEKVVIVPGICLVITAIFLIIADLADKGKKKPREATYLDAALIGTAQGVATMPGLSRSGTTITAAILCGFDKKFAVKYSFIMSIPAVLGAVVLELKDFSSDTISSSNVIPCIIATIIAAVVGYFSICVMLKLVSGKSYKGFAVYCAIMGLAVIGYGILK